jgi:hypothetical protein
VAVLELLPTAGSQQEVQTRAKAQLCYHKLTGMVWGELPSLFQAIAVNKYMFTLSHGIVAAAVDIIKAL